MRVRIPRSTGSGSFRRFGFGGVPGGSACTLYSLPPLLKYSVLVASGNQFGASMRPGCVTTYATRRSPERRLIVSSVLTSVVRPVAGGGVLSSTFEKIARSIRAVSCAEMPRPT